MTAYFDPTYYYLVLFDFEDLSDPTVINIRIWRVDPRGPGFAYAIVDWYANIRSMSTSKAPFNLWPFSLKWQLMKPELIYFAQVDSDNQIQTHVFPGERGTASVVRLGPLEEFSRATGFTVAMVGEVAAHFGVALPGGLSKLDELISLQKAREDGGWDEDELTDAVATAMYRGLVQDHASWLPVELRP
jgi:hypothetical protein